LQFVNNNQKIFSNKLDLFWTTTFSYIGQHYELLKQGL
jgi:hypothetical protein